MDIKEQFRKNCGFEMFVNSMKQSRQQDKFTRFVNAVYFLRTVDISYVNEKSLETLSLLNEIQVVFRFLTLDLELICIVDQH